MTLAHASFALSWSLVVLSCQNWSPPPQIGPGDRFWQPNWSPPPPRTDYGCQNQSGRTSFRCQKWSPPNWSRGPILAAKLVPRTDYGCQNQSGRASFGCHKWSPPNWSRGPILATKLVPRTDYGCQNQSGRTSVGCQKWSPRPALVAKRGPLNLF